MRIIAIDSSNSGAGDNSVALALLSVLRCVRRFLPASAPLACEKTAAYPKRLELCRGRGWKVQSYKVGPGKSVAVFRNNKYLPTRVFNDISQIWWGCERSVL